MLTALAPAYADTAYVRSGQEEGQGWIFAHRTGCWVATAGHVVKDPRAGVIVIGPGGASAQGDLIVRDPDHDLALIRLAGTLARTCPAAPVGDRDVLPMLDRVQHEGSAIIFERREGKPGKTNVSYGVEFVAMQLLAVSDRSPTFTVRAERRAGDDVAATDSGGPIRFRGTGIGEAGLPLGIVLAVERDKSVIALRMDVVRAFFDDTVIREPKPALRDAPFTVAGFSGTTPETACGPLNLLAAAASCGWRAVRTSPANPISITLDVGEIAESVTGVELQFSVGGTPKGVAVATSSRLDTNWQGERYCPVATGSHRVTCIVGDRVVRAVKIVIDGRAVQIIGIRVVSKER